MKGITAFAFHEVMGLVGDALFVLHTLENTNGNNQGMPNVLPVVTAREVVFENNTASSDVGTAKQ